jgi:hypothetical protein
VDCGIGNDLADREGGACLIALMGRDVEAVRVAIDVCDPQLLPAGIIFREATGEKLAGGREAVELQREFGALIPHTEGSM